MDKNEALSRLTYCDECGYWRSLNDKRFKDKYRGCVGLCNRPYESRVERYKDDFCSRGVKRRDSDD